MIDPRILRALGLPEAATDEQIAEGMRALAGLAPEGTTDAALWVRFVTAVDRSQYGLDGLNVDEAILANRIAEQALADPRRAGEQRFGSGAWDRELGVGQWESDEWLRGLVYEQIIPRVSDLGL